MPARYLLDTNILSQLIKHPQGPVTQRLAGLDAEQICTSIVVACELRYGAAKRGSTSLDEKVEALLSSLSVLPLDGATDRHYAEIRSTLERAGQPIGGNDLLVAAHARAIGARLVTHNVREFERVPNLTVENWLD
jgi:tRNA(fMet)-specific endonuclease VapC